MAKKHLVRNKAERFVSSTTGSWTFWFLAKAACRNYCPSSFPPIYNASADFICQLQEKAEFFASWLVSDPTSLSYQTPSLTSKLPVVTVLHLLLAPRRSDKRCDHWACATDSVWKVFHPLEIFRSFPHSQTQPKRPLPDFLNVSFPRCSKPLSLISSARFSNPKDYWTIINMDSDNVVPSVIYWLLFLTPHRLQWITKRKQSCFLLDFFFGEFITKPYWKKLATFEFLSALVSAVSREFWCSPMLYTYTHSFLLYINDLLFSTPSSVHSFAHGATLHHSLLYHSLHHANTKIDRTCNEVSVKMNCDLELISPWGSSNHVDYEALKNWLHCVSLK